MTAPDPALKIDHASLKSGDIIMQKDDDFFAIRLRLPGGCISSALLPKIAVVAESRSGVKFVSPPGKGSKFPA